jgi:hypothetical protein
MYGLVDALIDWSIACLLMAGVYLVHWMRR